jgi:hypothetical protein
LRIMTHKVGRNERMYVEDNKERTVYALDCVPSKRPKGSWTNGVEAWSKGTNSSTATKVGWFAPPRLRNKGHHGRSGPKPKLDRMAHFEEE